MSTCLFNTTREEPFFPSYSFLHMLAINLVAWGHPQRWNVTDRNFWGSHHPGNQEQNHKWWTTYGTTYNRLCIKMSEMKCKILLSAEIIIYCFKIFRETFNFLLPPLQNKSFFESWRLKKEGQILVSSVGGKARKQKASASVLFIKDSRELITNGGTFTYVPSRPKICISPAEKTSFPCFSVCYPRY